MSDWVEIPIPHGAVQDLAGNLLPNVPVTLTIKGTSTPVTHAANDAGGSQTTGGLITRGDGSIGTVAMRRRVLSGQQLVMTVTIAAETQTWEIQPVSSLVENRVAEMATSLLDPFYGITTVSQKNGTTDVSSRILAFLTDLDDDGASGFVPTGNYRITSPIEIGDKDNLTIDFAGGAYFQPEAAGDVLTLTNVNRTTIRGLRYRLLANLGSLGALLVLDGSTRVTLYEPEIWYHANIPDNQIDGIVFKNDSYWGEVVRPRSRVLSGGITGLLRRGVSFTTASNACKVIGGSLSSCYVGAYINAANATEVAGTAFETVSAAETIGVQLDGANTSIANNGGTRIHDIRLEGVDIGIDFAMLYQGPAFPGIYIGPLSNNMGEATEANLIRNPNCIPFQRHQENTIDLGSGWANFNTQIRAQAADSQSAAGRPLMEFRQRPLSAPVTSVTADPGTGAMSGSGTLTVRSTAAQGVTPVFPSTGTLRIDNEVFSYTGITSTTFTGVTRALGGTSAAAHAIGARVEAGLNRTFAVDTTGALIARSSSASPPAPADDRFILHHRAFITKLISWDISSSSCSVQQVVGDQAGGLTIVTAAFKASFRPGTTNVIDLGVTGTRWRNLYLSGVLDHSGASVGFYGATPAAKPTVTGSRGGNAALADLLTDLATLGLITDSSSA